MGIHAAIAATIVVVTLVALVRGRIPADLVMAACIGLMILTGTLTPAEALGGLASPSLITIAMLLVVAQGVTETGLIQVIARTVFGRPKTARRAIIRLAIPTAGVSAFVNNTPLVAMLLPLVGEFGRAGGIPPSRLYMPLAFAATLGGVCTLIGTSTNLIVNQLWSTTEHAPFHLFALLPIGLPACIVGLIALTILAPVLLPDRRPAIDLGDDIRSYTVEMEVARDGPLAGLTIETANLRGLPGLFLAEIERGDDLIPAPSPGTRLLSADRLRFVGIVDSVVNLQRIRGLIPATNQPAKLASAKTRRFLCEAVISDTCPLAGKSIREGRFRSVYDAAVIAVARNGERITGVKLGDVVLKGGDTLLLETHGTFLDRHRLSRDFLLVRQVEDSTPARHERAWIAGLILAAVVLIATLNPFGWSMFEASVLGAGLMILTRCCTGPQARRALNPRLLLILGGSLAIGTALERTGIASAGAGALLSVVGDSRPVLLAVTFFAAWIATELLSNATAAALIFPIAVAAAEKMGIDPSPVALLVMVGASASFCTPIGYQTNLMVQGPGGYRFTDYMRLGIPLGLIFGVTAVAAAIFFTG